MTVFVKLPIDNIDVYVNVANIDGVQSQIGYPGGAPSETHSIVTAGTQIWIVKGTPKEVMALITPYVIDADNE